ncbi:hypothetical protein LOK49_LG08G01011, partial [Camellia lanceoleosa]
MVSFISTVPSLVALAPLPSPTTNTTSVAVSKYPIHASTVRCKIEADNGSGDQFGRRDILKCFGATLGMEIIASSGSFVEEANAADLIQRRQRSEFQSSVKGTLFTAIKANPYLVPSLLTLAMNDAMTYDKATKSGGPNGSVRFRLHVILITKFVLYTTYMAINLLRYTGISHSQSALKSTFLVSAIRKCGGNEEKGSLLYTAYGSNGQQFGRSDAQKPNPKGRVPLWAKASVQEMKDKFLAIGFGPRQTLLATDRDVAPWVEKYQRSRETVSKTDYK